MIFSGSPSSSSKCSVGSTMAGHGVLEKGKLCENMASSTYLTNPHHLCLLRGEQQRSLRAALQGFTCRRLVGKLHDASPRGPAAVVRHDDGSFHRPELRKRLEEERDVYQI